MHLKDGAIMAMLALSSGLPAGCDPAPLAPCGYGQRATAEGCVAAPRLVVDADERVDGSCRDGADGPVCTSRRGIGVNACPVAVTTTAPIDTIGECALFEHAGRSPEQTFRGDGGLVIVGLAGGSVGLAPAPNADCFGTDLVPGRDNLFDTDEVFAVSGTGGPDFPAFEVEVAAPAPLAVARVSEVVRGEALPLQWEAAGADRVVVVVTSYDEALDRGAQITCIGDDDGAVDIDPAFTAALLASATTARVFVLRQNGAHAEDAASPGVIEASATVSDVVEVPLR
jgi:hypothetical protein